MSGIVREYVEKRGYGERNGQCDLNYKRRCPERGTQCPERCGGRGKAVMRGARRSGDAVRSGSAAPPAIKGCAAQSRYLVGFVLFPVLVEPGTAESWLLPGSDFLLRLSFVLRPILLPPSKVYFNSIQSLSRNRGNNAYQRYMSSHAAILRCYTAKMDNCAKSLYQSLNNSFYNEAKGGERD